jgi:hypothetical protein
MKTQRIEFALAGLLLVTCAAPAFATPLPGTIIDGSPPFTTTFDEMGNGTLTNASGTVNNFWANAAPYGLQYRLFAFVQPGNVVITDPDAISPTNPLGVSDNLHFDNDPNLGGILIYSSVLDENDPVHDLADVPLANVLYYSGPSDVFINEVGPEGNNGFTWNAGNAIYHGISDVPEPSSLALAALALIGFAAARARRRRR